MDNTKQKIYKFVKYSNSLINSLNLKLKKKLYIFYTIKKDFKISNFNMSVIFLITTLFLYLFYLSFPTLYNKDILQKDLGTKLFEKFNLDLSLTPSTTYLILPSPHFEIKDVKLFKSDANSSIEIAQIKKIKIFISSKNLFNQKKLKINKLTLIGANFQIKKEDKNFFFKYLDNISKDKKIIINKSKVFFKDNQEETISFFSINNFNLLTDIDKKFNKINIEGKIFNIPYLLKLKKEFEPDEVSNTSIKLKKLGININNTSTIKKEVYFAQNNLLFNQSKFITDYSISKDSIKFESKNSFLANKKISYKGQINLNPFYLNALINVDQYNGEKFINNSLIEILKSNLLYNKNFNGEITILTKEIFNNKALDESKILINFKNGKILLDNSKFFNKKIGLFKLKKGEIYLLNNELIFNGSFNLDINDQKNFYRVFQVPKSQRKKLESINFYIEKNFFQNSLKISEIRFNGEKFKSQLPIEQIIDNFQDNDKFNLKTWLEVKSFVRLIIANHFG